MFFCYVWKLFISFSFDFMFVVNVIVLMDASCGQYDIFGRVWVGVAVVVTWDRRVQVYTVVQLLPGRVYPFSVLQGCGIQSNQSPQLPSKSWPSLS